MKLAAFSCGRKWGNTEVFLKEALMAAEEMDIEVEFYRLSDYELHNCSACSPKFCPASSIDIDACPYKDDAIFLANRFLDSDGVLIGAPVYALSPGSLFFTFRDRIFGPKMDVASPLLGKPEASWVKGRFKARPGGLISVGGALTEHWTSLGLPNLYTATFSAQTDVVDQMNVFAVADPAEACVKPECLARARKLGQNVANAMLTNDHSWKGNTDGLCPHCHLNFLQVVPGTDQVVCPVCGVQGTLTLEDGKIAVCFPETAQNIKDNRLTIEGKKTHILEIDKHSASYRPHFEEAKVTLEKYKTYSACEVSSPCKEAKKSDLRLKSGKTL
jgi:multimeric flavodoxin WrbA